MQFISHRVPLLLASYAKLTLRLIQSNGVSLASTSASRLSVRASHFNQEIREPHAKNSKDVPTALFDHYTRTRSMKMCGESCIKWRVHNKLSYIFTKYSAIFWLRAA